MIKTIIILIINFISSLSTNTIVYNEEYNYLTPQQETIIYEEQIIYEQNPVIIIEEEINYNYQVLYLINEIRKEYGLNELIMDNTLTIIAEIRAEEATRFWSHTRPDGTKWTTLFSEYEVYGIIGENLAYGHESPQEVVDAWMNSESHRDNILYPDFNRIGIGIYDNNGVLYWAQSFAN